MCAVFFAYGSEEDENEETPKEKGPRGESDCVNSPRKKGKGGCAGADQNTDTMEGET